MSDIGPDSPDAGGSSGLGAAEQRPTWELRCRVTPEKLAEWNVAAAKAHPDHRRAAKAYSAAILIWFALNVGGLALPYFFMRIHSYPKQLTAFDGLVLATSLVVLFALVRSLTRDRYFGQYRRGVLNKLRDGQLDRLAGERAFTMTSELLAVSGLTFETVVRWPLVRAITELPEGICFELSAMLSVLVPSEVFSSHHQQLNFVADARKFWSQRREALIGTCPDCNYDLSGTESGRCPECGWEISVGELLPLHTRAR